MKGKFVVMMKRWWLTALVFTLSLSLTSCSKKKDNTLLQSGYGYTQCDGTMGSFDVYVFQSKNYSGMYELHVTPYQVDAGDIASITIANQALSYKQVVPQVVLQPNEDIFAALLTESDLYTYDILAVTPYDPSTNFAEQAPAKDTFCTINLPEGLDPQVY